MLESIKNIDKELLLYLNSKHTPFWDGIMITVTDRYTWVPFYIITVLLLVWKLKVRGIYIVLFLALLIIATDQISSSIFKPFFQRPRPCYESSIAGMVRAISGCGSKFGFVSSHAANTFAFATLLILLFYKDSRWILLLLPWAMLVSYSRIYLGVHYPGDIISGAFLGFLLAVLFNLIFKNLIDKKVKFKL